MSCKSLLGGRFPDQTPVFLHPGCLSITTTQPSRQDQIGSSSGQQKEAGGQAEAKSEAGLCDPECLWSRKLGPTMSRYWTWLFDQSLSSPWMAWNATVPPVGNADAAGGARDPAAGNVSTETGAHKKLQHTAHAFPGSKDDAGCVQSFHFGQLYRRVQSMQWIQRWKKWRSSGDDFCHAGTSECTRRVCTNWVKVWGGPSGSRALKDSCIWSGENDELLCNICNLPNKSALNVHFLQMTLVTVRSWKLDTSVCSHQAGGPFADSLPLQAVASDLHPGWDRLWQVGGLVCLECLEWWLGSGSWWGTNWIAVKSSWNHDESWFIVHRHWNHRFRSVQMSRMWNWNITGTFCRLFMVYTVCRIIQSPQTSKSSKQNPLGHLKLPDSPFSHLTFWNRHGFF